MTTYSDVEKQIEKIRTLHSDLVDARTDAEEEIVATKKIYDDLQKRVADFDKDMKQKIKKLRYDIGRLKKQKKKKK